jgi:phosphopantothenate synthetase
MPVMVKFAKEMRDLPAEKLQKIVDDFDNEQNLRDSIAFMINRLENLSKDLSSLREKVVELN